MDIIFGSRKAKVITERKDGPIYYHYTNRTAADDITRDGRIRNAGDGILLNTMAPDLFYRNEILANNYGTNVPACVRNRADYCVRILPSKLIDKKLTKNQHCSGRLTYVYDADIRVDQMDVFDKPKCTKDVQQVTCSLASSFKPTRSSPAMNDGTDAAFEQQPTKSRKISEIKVDLRRDLKLSQCYLLEYQDDSVTIFAFEWIKHGMNRLRKLIDDDIVVNIADCKKYILSDRVSLRDLQIVARNESSNTSGRINFGNYNGISKEVIYSLKDLNRQTVIIGKDLTTHYGGYPHYPRNERVPQTETVYVCDLIGLQFQQSYNTGRLVLVGEDLPKGLLDEFIYEHVVKEEKPTTHTVRSDSSGRFVECSGVFFDSKAYVEFVANDVLLAGIALNQCATEPLNFKFLKYGTGFFSGQFRHLLERFIGRGVAEGLENLLKNLPTNHRIKGIELPFFEPDAAIDAVCAKYNVELKYSKDDALKKTRTGCVTATTNSADPHSMTGNVMDFGSVDGAIAENLRGKAIKFSPIINGLMKECFVGQNLK